MKYLVSWRWIRTNACEEWKNHFGIDRDKCCMDDYTKCTEKTCPLVKGMRKENN